MLIGHTRGQLAEIKATIPKKQVNKNSPAKELLAFISPNRQTHNINLSMQQIQNKPQPSAHWKGYEFFHGELYSVNDFDDFKCPAYEIKGRENPTSDGPEEVPKAKLRTFSKKKLTPKYEISFDKEFMKEHKAAFRKHYQNYIESIKQKLTPEKIQSILKCFFKSQTNKINQSALDILKTDSTYLTNQEKNQFMKDLEHEQKFHEFLDFVAEYCNPNIAGGFISVSQMVWMAYVPMQNRDLKVSKVVQFGEKVAVEEIKDCLNKHFKDQCAQVEEIKEEFLRLIEVFCTTILLTITGYFENPYFTDDGQLNGLKRPWNCDISSDEEESFDSWQSFASCKKSKN